MKKAAGIITGATALAAAAATGAIFRYTFFFTKKQWAATGYPNGSQYQPYREMAERLIARIQALPYEEVSILSDDGLKLYGKYYHHTDGAPLEIMCHGYHGKAERDFCGGFWLAKEAGHNVLLIDERAHGKSEGHVITFGIRERYDCLGWVRYAVSRFGKDVKIILEGVSMGAATVLMASELELPENVKGIIADCGYSSPGAIVRNTAAGMGYPADILYHFAKLGARLLGRFDLEESSASEALAHYKIPVLFIHGEDDRFVPCRMTYENYQACASEKTLFTVPGAGHTLCYMVDNEGYRREVRRFLDRIGCGAADQENQAQPWQF